MFKPSTWDFNDAILTADDAKMFAPASADLFVLWRHDRSTAEQPNAVGAGISQGFSVILAEELQSRALVARRIEVRSLNIVEKLGSGANRMRVELTVTLDVPKATTNDLIDALTSTRRKCAVRSGEPIKIILRADLKAAADSLKKAPDSLAPSGMRKGLKPRAIQSA